MTVSSNRGYVPEIDQLRAGAALLVVFYHGFNWLGGRLAYGPSFDSTKHWVIAHDPLVSVIVEGHSGVGLFIVLSGFVLSLGTVGRQVNYGRFLLARILRIYPLLIVFWVAEFAAQPAGLAGTIATLLPFNTVDTNHEDFAAMFWAVAVEFQCYFVFPFLLLFSDRMGTRFLLQVIAAAIVLRILAVFAAGANPRDISYWTVLGRIDQFCLGMIAARLYVIHGWNTRINGLWFVPAAFAVLLMLWAFNQAGGGVTTGNWKIMWPTMEGIMWTPFLLCYLRAGQFLPRCVARPLTRLGEISYSLYLVHFVVLKFCLMTNICIRATGVVYYDALLITALIALPVAILISILLYETIEKPFLQLRPRYVE